MRSDIEQAINTFDNKKMQPNKKELKSVEELLREDERVLYISNTNLDVTTAGKKERIPGVCVLTSQRFIFHKNEYKLLGIGVGGDTTESIALDRIDSVNSVSTLAVSYVQFHAMTKSYNILCPKKEMKLLQQTFESAISDFSAQKNAPAPAAAVAIDPVAQIKQLSELHDAGILSDAEFETKKADLLSRI